MRANARCWIQDAGHTVPEAGDPTSGASMQGLGNQCPSSFVKLRKALKVLAYGSDAGYACVWLWRDGSVSARLRRDGLAGRVENSILNGQRAL
jgi:hypothetical protein